MTTGMKHMQYSFNLHDAYDPYIIPKAIVRTLAVSQNPEWHSASTATFLSKWHKSDVEINSENDAGIKASNIHRHRHQGAEGLR
jgi:hypothetical protein